MERRWLKVAEASYYLGINKKTLYSILSRGELPYVKRRGIGIRLDKTKLDDFLLECETQSVEQQLEGQR